MRTLPILVVTAFLFSTTLPAAERQDDIPLRNWAVPSQAASNRMLPMRPVTDSLASVNGVFVPVTPCRIVDTRLATGPYGGPTFAAGETRSYNIPGGPCTGIPAAIAYSLNFTVVNFSVQGSLKAYPTGMSPVPVVSTLNFNTGASASIANAAIVPANTTTAPGSIDVFVNQSTNVIIDINGYFADAAPTSINTPNTLVSRDAFGNFAAGNIAARIVDAVGFTEVSGRAVVSASDPTHITNGGPTFRGDSSFWTATSDGEWLQIDLGAAIQTAGISFGTYWREAANLPVGYTIETKGGLPASSYVTMVTANGNTRNSVAHYWPLRDVRYVRLTVTARPANGIPPQPNQAWVAGLSVLGTAGSASSGNGVWSLAGPGGMNDVVLRTTGNVGIGTTAPTERLHVSGNLLVSGTITGGSVINAIFQDVAEYVPTPADLDPGTVVIVRAGRVNEVVASTHAYDTAVAGVVSAQPGIILGTASPGKSAIATTGRVRVHVDATQSPIEVGDLLVTSDVAGRAMKSRPLDLNGFAMHRPGTIVGKALEPLMSGPGDILVLLSLQ